ncbi:PadR family transcriptional regulator [Patulibacter sp. NPDC049589]|uniref:PadR family transcriptional regulator n=1 Tax=Patulibacter sp. NPDC049589 TaxID=3154731 RepID=UPI0034451F1A
MKVNETSFLALASLLQGPRHGYGIKKDIERLSDGRLRVSTGSLYASLDRLTAEDLVVRDADEVVDGRSRRYFRLTDSGRERVLDEARRMQATSRDVLRLADEATG